MNPTSITAPIRIGAITFFPGDILFSNEYGVASLPAHISIRLVSASEMTGLRDEFERLLLQHNKYSGGEIHGDWSDKIKDEFRAWFSKYPKVLTISRENIETYLAKDGI